MQNLTLHDGVDREAVEGVLGQIFRGSSDARSSSRVLNQFIALPFTDLLGEHIMTEVDSLLSLSSLSFLVLSLGPFFFSLLAFKTFISGGGGDSNGALGALAGGWRAHQLCVDLAQHCGDRLLSHRPER